VTDPGDEAVGENSMPTFCREPVHVEFVSFSSGSYSVFKMGGLMLINSRSLGPNNLNFLFFIHGVLFGFIAVRAAFARRKKCVKHITAPELNNTNSATRDDDKFESNVPVIA
jgi:hypothetical protein